MCDTATYRNRKENYRTSSDENGPHFIGELILFFADKGHDTLQIKRL